MSAGEDRLREDEQLDGGESLWSPNRHFHLEYQTDGNLVLYRQIDMAARWASNTDGRSVGRCIMQLDGNLVVYDGEGHARWASGTNGKPHCFLLLQDDGDLIVCGPVWRTNTVQGAYPTGAAAVTPDVLPGQVIFKNNHVDSMNGAYRLIYQLDGNLVLYRRSDNTALWPSDTCGRPAGWCEMSEENGNLLMYDPNGYLVWQSASGNYPGAYLRVQDNGTVVIVDPVTGRVVWTRP
jgi:outer membrane protein assembly factor BamB